MALAAIVVSLLAMTSCGGDKQTLTDGEERQLSTAAPTGAERTVGQTPGKRAAGDHAAGREKFARSQDGDNAVAPANGGKEDASMDSEDGSAQKVTLKIGGDDGTLFSGMCIVGGQEEIIGGRVPARYEFNLGGDRLECGIRNKGGGALEVVLAAGSNVRSVQQTDAQKATINLAYSSNGGISSSIHG